MAEGVSGREVALAVGVGRTGVEVAGKDVTVGGRGVAVGGSAREGVQADRISKMENNGEQRIVSNYNGPETFTLFHFWVGTNTFGHSQP